MRNSIGIMQGRLSPPVGGKIQAFPCKTWQEEFYRASEIGIDLIDWIVEEDRLWENPLLTSEGASTIERVAEKTGIYIGAVCADYFMDCPLMRCSQSALEERISVLDILIDRLGELDIPFLEIPFVDNSVINDRSELMQIVRLVKPRLDKAHDLGVTLAFETSLPAEMFRRLLDEFAHPAGKANYDMGNSASLGYDPVEELAAYGEDVVTVHVKDRVLNGGTVPLGEGDTDFGACFEMLRERDYGGPFILQVARDGSEMELAKRNMLFVKKLLRGEE